MKVLSMLAISVTVKLHIRVAQQILKWINVKVLEGAFNHEKALGECDCKFSQTFIWSSSQNGIKSPPISHYTRINNNNCETRHCSVVSVGCPLYSDTQLTDPWQLWRGRAGDALDSRRQDRHYARKVARIASVMAVILSPIWNLLSLISLINLLFSLIISLKVRRDRTQYPLKQTRISDHSPFTRILMIL